MHWNSVAEFFAMGGYGFYVWGSFGLTALVALGEVLTLRSQHRQLLQTLRTDLLSEGTPS